MSWLLDINLLLASRWITHPEHEAASVWLEAQPEFHTTPIVELGFLRVSLSPGYSASARATPPLRKTPNIPSLPYWLVQPTVFSQMT